MNGLLLIDKPVGISSFDVIRRLRKAIDQKKFGHAGTLDPMASGLLPILANKGTRLVPFIMGGRKRYRATVKLGEATNTDDTEGEVVATGSLEGIDAEKVEACLVEFIGEIQQVPPRYSAIRVKGKRAYAMARAGKDVELEARTVTVYGIENIEVDLPRVQFDIECGKGTYIRSVARDLGERLGCHGYLLDLRRTQVGPFRIEQSVPLQSIVEGRREAAEESLVSLYDALEGMPVLELAPDTAHKLSQGRVGLLDHLEPGAYRVPVPDTDELLAVVIADGKKVKKRVFRPDWQAA